MKDKEKQIEEMAITMNINCGECYSCKYKDEIHCADFLSAEELYNVGYRKLPENSVVLSADEFANLKKYAYNKGSKETAEKIYKDIRLFLDNKTLEVIARYFKVILDVEIKE